MRRVRIITKNAHWSRRVRPSVRLYWTPPNHFREIWYCDFHENPYRKSKFGWNRTKISVNLHEDLRVFHTVGNTVLFIILLTLIYVCQHYHGDGLLRFHSNNGYTTRHNVKWLSSYIIIQSIYNTILKSITTPSKTFPAFSCFQNTRHDRQEKRESKDLNLHKRL